MKKIFLIIFLLISGKISAQVSPPVTPPVSPIKLTTVEFDFEPSTNKYFIWNGSTYKWWNPVSSTQLVSILSGYYPQPVGTTDQYIRGDGSLATLPGAATITSSNGVTKVGNDIQLGGNLSQFTIISTNNNNLFIGDLTGHGPLFALSPSSGFAGFGVADGTYENGLSISNLTGGNTQDKISRLYGVVTAGAAESSIDIHSAPTGGKQIFITDQIGNEGATYADDYTANQLSRDRAITDVGGIKQLIGIYGGATASNGLTNTSGNITLGGNLTQNTNVGLNGHSLVFNDPSFYSYAQFATDSFIFQAGDSFTNFGQFTAGGGQSQMAVQNGSVSKQIRLNSSGIIFLDQSAVGPINGGDYEANFIKRSLITKQYGDSHYAVSGGGVTSFNSRAGTVISQSSDYSAYYGTLSQQNTNVSNIATNATNISNEITRATAAEVSNYTAIGVKQPRIIASLPTQTTTRPLIGDSVTTAFSKLILRGDSISAAINLITPATVTYTSGTGVSNNFTNVSIQNSFIEGIWRDGIEYQVITSGSPVGNNALVNTTTGVVTFQDNINSGEYIKVRYRGIAGISTISGVGQIIFVSSYAAMSAQASGSQQKLFIVQSDEVFFAGLPAIYTYYNGNLSRGVVQQIIN